MMIKGEKAMNRLSLIRYTSAAALGLSTLWSAAVCAAEDAGAFDKIHQIRAGDLNIGYVDIGPRDGQPVILLHGWPYDIQSYAQVAPALAQKGYRVIVPYLRGYGTTRFLSASTPRNGQPSAMAADIVHLMDALNIRQADLAGFDWGAHGGYRRRAVAAAGEIPGLGERVSDQQSADWRKTAAAAGGAVVVVSVLFCHPARRSRLPAEHPRLCEIYLASGVAAVAIQRRDFARTARALDNPDHVAITISNYRWRLGLEKGEAKYAGYEQRLAALPPITVPTITLEGANNGAPHPAPASYRAKFTGKYEHRDLQGAVGHNPPQEDPATLSRRWWTPIVCNPRLAGGATLRFRQHGLCL
jgi:pimeloyl-ACP methyl ester carboxylesterase